MAQRGNGEGSVFQEGARSGRTDGRWVAQVVVDGRYRRRIAPTEAKAKRLLRDLQTQIATGHTPGDGNLTITQLLDQWKTNALPARDLSPRTIAVYEWCVDVLVDTIGSHRADRLTPEIVEAAFTNLAEHGHNTGRPISRTSLIKIRSVLGKALDYGFRRQLVTRNIARIVELPTQARRPEPGRSLTIEQSNQLLDSTADDRLHALWRLMLMTGLRPGEATGLTWDDIDLDQHIIYVRRSLKLEHGNLIITDTLKTTRSRRSLKADPTVIDALRTHQHNQAAEQAEMGQIWSNPDNLVFTNTIGGPIDPNNLRRTFSKTTQDAGLGHWHPHELRHTATSILSAAGIPLERIADVLGHDGTRMTALIYRHHISPTINDAARIGTALQTFSRSPG